MLCNFQFNVFLLRKSYLLFRFYLTKSKAIANRNNSAKE